MAIRAVTAIASYLTYPAARVVGILTPAMRLIGELSTLGDVSKAIRQQREAVT